MTRRRVHWAVAVAVGALAAAGWAAAVRAAWRKRTVEPEPATQPREALRSGMPPVIRARRNWAALIAVPALLMILLTCALAVARPEPRPRPLSRFSLSYAEGLGDARMLPGARVSHCWAPTSPPPGFRIPEAASDITRRELSAGACQTLALGATALVGGLPGEVQEVTLSAVTPFMFRLQVRNLSSFGPPLFSPWLWAASEETGWIQPVDSPGPERRLPSGSSGSRLVVFAPPGEARLVRFRLGLAPDNVDWVLG